MNDILNLNELKTLIHKGDTGLLFCIGKSLISQIIRAKTRLDTNEIVPSHVALIVNGEFLYESTSNSAKLGNKHIPAGVRRMLLADFYKLEKLKETEYYFYPCTLDIKDLEKYVHFPYGIDSIVDFVLKDGSDGVSRGLICSQYANKVAHIMDNPCPSPAVLYRYVRSSEDLFDYENIQNEIN